MTDDTPLADLPNLGPASAAMLARIGVRTRGDLARVGPVLAFRALRDVEPSASLNLLWAMHGALTGERWDRLGADAKAALRADLAEALAEPPTSPTLPPPPSPRGGGSAEGGDGGGPPPRR